MAKTGNGTRDNLEGLLKKKKLEESLIFPKEKVKTAPSRYFIDFGKAAFGTVLLTIPSVSERRVVTLHLGESLTAPHRIDRKPKGSILYRKVSLIAEPGVWDYRVTIPPNDRNTGKAAVLMPPEIGEVMPFRYCELEDFPWDDFTVKQAAVHYPFDDGASHFSSSDETLNAVWGICKYTIKATTFCGLYVDGDRERIPYEGDAYINQLSHYCVDAEYSLARATQEYLFDYPTWPTDWQFHMILMAWEDWMYVGEPVFLERYYDMLKLKTLGDLAREDGLISTEDGKCNPGFEKKHKLHHDRYIFEHGMRDLVDWPPGSFTESGTGERDNHEMKPYNSVINAFHYRSLVLMSRMADGLGKTEESQNFSEQAAIVKASFNRVFFNRERKVYIDGEGSEHSSLHSNMFALAFGLAGEENKSSVLEFVKSRGMGCSVYGAQYLLEALYRSGEEEYALGLMTARHDRSWWNMIAAGSTMTMEAWDWRYKNNLDWNHAWGAAPANIIPRYLMGVRPLEPGYRKILIRPQVGSLSHAECRCPTINGPVKFDYRKKEDGTREYMLEIPKGATAVAEIPVGAEADRSVLHNGTAGKGKKEGSCMVFDNLLPGCHRFSC